MRAKPYSKYKRSGVEWLGDLPAHWEAKRLKTSATYRVSNVDKVPSEEEMPVRLSEQAAIAEYLGLQATKIDGMVAKVETAIERLQEYRVALVTGAVTGKIDVRGQSADNRRVLASAS